MKITFTNGPYFGQQSWWVGVRAQVKCYHFIVLHIIFYNSNNITSFEVDNDTAYVYDDENNNFQIPLAATIFTILSYVRCNISVFILINNMQCLSCHPCCDNAGPLLTPDLMSLV